MLAGCSWLSISALCSSGCPLLRSLDLRYADGVKDSQIRDLVTPPGEQRTLRGYRLIARYAWHRQLLIYPVINYYVLFYCPCLSSRFTSICLLKLFDKNSYKPLCSRLWQSQSVADHAVFATSRSGHQRLHSAPGHPPHAPFNKTGPLPLQQPHRPLHQPADCSGLVHPKHAHRTQPGRWEIDGNSSFLGTKNKHTHTAFVLLH